MPLTADEFSDACRKTCPRCDAGNEPRWRPETKEFVHDSGTKTQFTHAYCLATGLRKFYEAQKNG